MTSNGTMIFDFVDGKAEQVFPCRCGQTHRGPYAAYDYGHHNCFHDKPLIAVAFPEDETDLTADLMEAILADQVQVMCPQCGQTFFIEAAGRQ